MNAALGGAFVGPWEAEELDEGLVEACIGLTTGLPKMRQGLGEVEAIFEHWRGQHPTYRK